MLLCAAAQVQTDWDSEEGDTEKEKTGRRESDSKIRKESDSKRIEERKRRKWENKEGLREMAEKR